MKRLLLPLRAWFLIFRWAYIKIIDRDRVILHSWMLYCCLAPGPLYVTMTFWFIVIVINVFWQAVWTLLFVLRIRKLLWEKNRVQNGNSCKYSRSLLVLHSARLSLNLVSFLQLPNFIYLLPLPLHLFVHFATSRGQSKIARTVSVPYRCNSEFAFLLGKKCHIVSLRVLWPNALPGSDFPCRISLLWMLSIPLIDLSLGNRTLVIPSLRTLPVRCNIVLRLEPLYFGTRLVYWEDD